MLPTFLPVLSLTRDHAGGKTCPVPTSIQGPEADGYSKGGVHTRKALLPVNTRADAIIQATSLATCNATRVASSTQEKNRH